MADQTPLSIPTLAPWSHLSRPGQTLQALAASVLRTPPEARSAKTAATPPFPAPPLQRVNRAPYAIAATIQHVGIDHRVADIFVTQ